MHACILPTAVNAVSKYTVKMCIEDCYQFCCLVNRGTMGVNSLPKTVSRQHHSCDLSPGRTRRTAPESSMLTTWIPSHKYMVKMCILYKGQHM